MNDQDDVALDLEEDDNLPWLESAEDYEGEDEPTFLQTAIKVLLGLLLVAAVIGGLYWLQNRETGEVDGNGELIAAQEGDYKVKPEDPQAKQFEGEGDASFATSEGKAVNPKLATADVKSTPVGKGNVRVQLGAFSTTAKANTAWNGFAKRFAYIGSLPKNVGSVKVDSGTVYRLSAVAPNLAQAKSVCAKLKAAGEKCFVAQ